ncbi:MAG: AAA family ATPase, partial [Elusimicrobiota bacterium]
DRYKVFIIDEAHMLSTSAFNALLKTIEEPPAHVVFILATTEAHKIPATIASRCQRFKFRPVAADLLRGHLASIAKKEKLSVEPEALDLLSRAAEGSLRDAVSLLDQCRSVGEGRVTLESVREMFGFVSQELLLGVAQALLARDAKALAGWLKLIYEEGVEPAQLLKDLRAGIESGYLEKLGAGGRVDPVWEPVFSGVSAEGLGFLLRRLNRALEELRFGDSPRLALELGLFSVIESAHDLGAWVSRLEALEKRLSSGGGGAQPVLAPVARAQPVSAPTAGAAISWPALIEAVSKTKITLGSALERAHGETKDDGGYRIRFSKPFDLDCAKRSSVLIEEALARLAGRGVSLELSLGAPAPAPVTEIIDAGLPEPKTSADAPPGTRWKDIGEGGAPAGGLKNAESVFGGKARIIKKPAA